MNRNEKAARLLEAANHLDSVSCASRRDRATADWLRATAERVQPHYGRNHSWSGSRFAMRVADAILANPA